MLRNASLFLCAGLLLFAVACSDQSTTAAAVDTRDADVKAVRDVEAAWARDSGAKDAEKFAGYYADDGSLLLPNAPIINGKEAIKAAVKGMMTDPNFALSFQGTRAEASKGGDMVSSIGTYTMTVSDPKTKKPLTDKGKYLTVFKKQADGSWKAIADMVNSDMPPGA
ncbi:MAG TPA: SgcJ/EcaC family oxidoreductase [Candidatus Acidoferrales bacterium]|jgi:uncharacterized protein (TIGR02246 family)|nr:SgcJ/EcaC family oxidoreductase [Candidatus Acidoferrales bacterium]